MSVSESSYKEATAAATAALPTVARSRSLRRRQKAVLPTVARSRSLRRRQRAMWPTGAEER
jgi:hypothetical protein